MARLSDSDIRTTEVLGWTGLHVFHAPFSTCSQKLRMFLAVKQLAWTSHPIDLAAKQNLSDRYLGINPRGLVPALVDDGAVHIESNDILLHLEKRFPTPSLVAPECLAELRSALQFEDDLHLAIRTLSLLFLFSPPAPPKSAEDLDRYAAGGSGTVGGEPDPGRAREIGYWSAFARGEIADDAARAAAARFRAAFDHLDERLTQSAFLLGDAFSILDIAWMVYANRLVLAGYPLARLHPHVGEWFDRESLRPGIAEEIAMSKQAALRFASRQAALRERNQTLAEVCFPAEYKT